LDNAVDHASKDRKSPGAAGAAATRKPDCIVTVADNGRHHQGALSKIFEPFYTTRKEGRAWSLHRPATL
jgi:C4-dicarboxylate-specific signal transduction histidine kinase